VCVAVCVAVCEKGKQKRLYIYNNRKKDPLCRHAHLYISFFALSLSLSPSASAVGQNVEVVMFFPSALRHGVIVCVSGVGKGVAVKTLSVFCLVYPSRYTCIFQQTLFLIISMSIVLLYFGPSPFS